MQKRNLSKVTLIIFGVAICLLVFEIAFAARARFRNAEYEQRISYESLLSNIRNAGVEAITSNIEDTHKNLVSLLSMKNFKDPYKKYDEIAYLTESASFLTDLNKIASPSIVSLMTNDYGYNKAIFGLSKEISSLCINLSSKQALSFKKIALKIKNGSTLDNLDISYLSIMSDELNKIIPVLQKVNFSKDETELEKQTEEVKKINKELSSIKYGR